MSTLTWENGRQLKSFDGNTYTYNGNGIRTSKTIGGATHTYTLDGTKILREAWSGNTLIPLYDNEDAVCGILYNSVPYYFLKNLQGDVIAITNANAETVARYTYDAWGVCKTLNLDGTENTNASFIGTINPYRYRSYYYDAEIGMYYLQSRYYNPVAGRFVNGDKEKSLRQSKSVKGYNIFAYCDNCSVNSLDRSGELFMMAFDYTDYASATFFAINEFYRESVKLKNHLDYWNSAFSSSVEKVDSYLSFVTKWNALAPQDVVFINCHASPTTMNKGGMGIDKLNKISSLRYKNIKALILLGCNAAHSNYLYKNVAYEFSKRISGCVMASDGTVIDLLGHWFHSVGDSKWKAYMRNTGRKNNGWVIYKRNNFHKTGLKCITVLSAIKYLKNNCFLRLDHPNDLNNEQMPKMIPIPDYFKI